MAMRYLTALFARYLSMGGAAASDTNRLAVSSDTSLFTHAGNGHQVKINKSLLAQTASILFQSNDQARAEIGLIASNQFEIRTTNDGSTFVTAIKVAPATGIAEIFNPVLFTGQAGPPASPSNGHFWHDSTRGQFMARVAGETRVIDQQGDIPYVIPPAGEFMMTTMGTGGATTVLSGAANRTDIFPFMPLADVTIDALGVNCTTAVAAALCKLVVYDSLSNGQPGTLLLETGTVDISTTGNKTISASMTFYRGRTYWLGVRHSSTAALSGWALPSTPDISGGTTMLTTSRKILRRTITFGNAAPSSWGFLSSEINGAVPTAIWLRKA